jgi:hypothetical protein
MLVVDASIALTWCFEDEVTAATEAIGAHVDADGAVVPNLWRLEVANIRVNGTLAMLDRALARAARHSGVAVAS